MKKSITYMTEVLLFSSLLLAANAGLFAGIANTSWTLLPSAIRQGEWWRLLLHPWVHASGYHLLLDASAFLSLFFMLDRNNPIERWTILAAAWASQLMAAWLGEPQIDAIGLCGLSGVAHGLFAAVCVQWRCQPELSRIGSVLLIVVIAKSIWEAATGHVFMSSFHLGNVGSPLTLCHGGGTLGGILAAYLGRFCVIDINPEIP